MTGGWAHRIKMDVQKKEVDEETTILRNVMHWYLMLLGSPSHARR